MATTALVRRDPTVLHIEAAWHALRRASTLPDVKAIHDAAVAAEIYAKRQQLGEDVEALAYSIKIRALEKLGVLLDQAKRANALNGGTRGYGRPKKGGSSAAPPKDARPTLADLKIDKKTSMRAQKLASLPAKTRTAIANQEQSLTQALAQARHGQRVPTNVQISTGSRDARDVKRELTNWLDTYSIAGRRDPAFVRKMEDLKRVLKTSGLRDTVEALVNRAHEEWV